MASRMYISFTLACLALFGFTTVSEAGEESLDKNTVFVVTVDDWQQSVSNAADSDVGRFLAEPSVAETAERLTTGFSKLLSDNFEGDDAAKDNFKMIWDHLARMNKEMTGEFVLGIGYRMDPDMGMPMPNIIIDFHGPADFGDVHRKMLETLGQTLEAGGQMAIPASFAIGDIEFTGLEMMPGVGLYVGQFEDHHVVASNKGSLQSYLASGDTAVGERFATTDIYKAAENTLRRGDSSFYLNLDAIWNLTPMIDMMVGAGSAGGEEFGVPDDEPVPSKIIEAIGLDAIGGIASKFYYTEDGEGSDAIIAMRGRPGILGLFPEQNGDISLPPMIPAEAASAQLMRMNFSKILDIVTNIGSIVSGTDPEEIRAEMDASFEGVKLTTGIDIRELISSLAGPIFMFTPPLDPDAPPPNPMAMMMGGGMGGVAAFNMGIELTDRAPWEAAMKSLGGPEMMGSALKTEEFQGREVWSFDPLGDVPPEFAGDGPQFIPAWTFEDDWLVVSLSKDDLHDMLRLADDEGGAHLGSSGRTARVLAKVKSTQGMSITLQNTGAALSQAADIIRPVLGILPLMAPDLAQDEKLLFLFDPSNIPESTLFVKYFGWTASRISIVPEGMKVYTFTEHITDASDSPEKEDPDKGSGL